MNGILEPEIWVEYFRGLHPDPSDPPFICQADEIEGMFRRDMMPDGIETRRTETSEYITWEYLV